MSTALDPAIAALHRAMPYTRLVDCGVNPADARLLMTLTGEGQPWTDVAATIADERASKADAAESAGHLRTAYAQARWAVGASLFAQMAENDDTPLKRDLYARYSDHVARVARLSTTQVSTTHDPLWPPSLERVEVKHRDGSLSGWLSLPPAGSAAATVIAWGGLSGWGAAYLRLADALTSRGVACLLAEGPGQGEPRLHDRIFLDAHVADGFARFLDVVEADDRLGSAIGIQGNSFGGLFAAHLAAQDDRVAACVVNGAPSAPEVPPFRTARAQIAAAIGSEDEATLADVLDQLRFDAGRHRIGCPVLVLHGEEDPLVPDPAIQAPFVDAAGDHGRMVTWPRGEHTLYGHAAERDAVVADWFCDSLG